VAPPTDGLPPAYVDVAGSNQETPPSSDAPPPYPAEEKKEEKPKAKPKKDWFGRVIEEPVSIEGTGTAADDNAPVPGKWLVPLTHIFYLCSDMSCIEIYNKFLIVLTPSFVRMCHASTVWVLPPLKLCLLVVRPYR
jgi:hypothetical protein